VRYQGLNMEVWHEAAVLMIGFCTRFDTKQIKYACINLGYNQ
jgi:hypothetical protein